MKRFFLIGGFIGFTLTFGSSLAASGNLNLALRDGMFGCLVVAFGFRFIYRQLELGALHVLQSEMEVQQDMAPQVNGNGKHAHQSNHLNGSSNEE